MLKATIENWQMRGSRAMLRRIESRALMSSGCRVADAASCGAKFTITFTFSGASRTVAFHRRLLLERLGVGGLHDVGRDIQGHLLVFGGQRGFDIPIEGADALGAVAHEPVDVVLAFADVEAALEVRGTLSSSVIPGTPTCWEKYTGSSG